MVTVSVIIPIYNVSQYVERCLQSLMSQDVCGVEMECLIVDDCGTDDSMRIVRRVIDNYHGFINFSIVSHEHNRGLSAARNTGLEHARGEYVLFVDSDDYLTPGAIQYLIDNLLQHSGVDMVMGNVKNMKDNSLLINNLDRELLVDDADELMQRMLRHQIYLYAWNKLIRRELLMDNNIRFIDGILYEDQSWSLMLFGHLSSVLMLPRITYVYEYNQSSIVNTTFITERADRVVYSQAVSIDYMLNNPPAAERYRRNLAVDYLMFMANFATNGVDVVMRCPISADASRPFFAVRRRLFLRSLRYGRLLVAFFLTLMFPPFCYIQKWRFFRRHYYDLEFAVNRISHLTDCLHRKNSL